MNQLNPSARPGCDLCAEPLGFDFSFAFQPILDLSVGGIVSYEALVRGLNGEGAGSVFANVNPNNLYAFDQNCRTKAIELAARLGLDKQLNINFSPNAVYQPELCIRTTLQAAQTYDFPRERIVFEVTEGEQIKDRAHLKRILDYYKGIGFTTAIDDFGAGYSGLNLLAEFQPDIIKVDRELITDIHSNRPRQATVHGIHTVCRDLGIRMLAEGVETAEEFRWLRDNGVELFQGYYFARPGFQTLPEVPAELLAV